MPQSGGDVATTRSPAWPMIAGVVAAGFVLEFVCSSLRRGTLPRIGLMVIAVSLLFTSVMVCGFVVRSICARVVPGGTRVVTPVVRAARLHGYTGPFKVQLILPPNMTDLGADETTVLAGQDQAKLILKAPANAVPGNRPNLVVRATGVIDDNIWLVHETKINVNVVK